MDSRLVTGMAWLALSVSARSDVLTVAPTGADFSNLEDAVAAAGEGDVLLITADLSDVQSPNQTIFVDGKSLAIVGAPGAAKRTINTQLLVRNLGPDQFFVLSRIRLWDQYQVLPGCYDEFAGYCAVDACLFIEDCQGTVRIARSSMWGTNVQGAGDLAMSEVTTDGPGPVAMYDSMMRMRTSNVALYGTSLIGSIGTHSCCSYYCSGLGVASYSGSDGTPGYSTHSGLSYLSDVTIQGGGPGLAFGTDFCVNNPQAGPGLQLIGPTFAQVDALGSSIAGNPPLQVGGGTDFNLLPGTPRRVTSETISTAGVPIVFSFVGEPGDDVYINISASTDFLYPHPLFNGPALFAQPTIRRTYVGTLPANGRLDVSFPTPGLPTGDEGRVWFVQGFFRDMTGTLWAADSLPWIQLAN